MAMAMLVFLLAASATAQFDYVPAYGPMPKPAHCQTTQSAPAPYKTPATPTFAYTQTQPLRTASPAPPLDKNITYGPSFGAVSSLVASLKTTTWTAWNPNVTASVTDAHDPYGTASWSALWNKWHLPNFTTGYYSTTVQPTSLPASELVYPPAPLLEPQSCYDFPPDFMIGVASSAGQIEGATAQEGKAPTFLDTVSLLAPGRAPDYVTNENYYLYKQDITRLAALGFRYYSFSISWARILPFVRPGTPLNKQALDHYNDLIDFAISKGLTPVVTLIHNDSPLSFYANASSLTAADGVTANNGEYQHPDFAHAFIEYGKQIMARFADRVSHWVTYNEPFLATTNGRSFYNVLHTHASLWHFYHDDLKASGKVGLKLNHGFGLPLDPSNASHVEAAEQFNSFELGVFLDPLVHGADYPPAAKESVPDLPPLSDADRQWMRNTLDFVGLDHYTGNVVSPLPDRKACLAASNAARPRPPYCVTLDTHDAHGWNIGYRSQSYVYSSPAFLRAWIQYTNYHYPGVDIVISEIGFPVFGEADKEASDQLFDTPRSEYYLLHLEVLLKAIHVDGAKVTGLWAWSFADNWEFGDYGAQFGIQTVNRTAGPDYMRRRFKRSAFDIVGYVEARRGQVGP